MKAAGTLRKVRQKLLQWVLPETQATRRIERSLLYLLRLAFQVGRELNQNNCPQRAAALSYTTIFSLVPVTALFVLYFKMAGKLDAYSSTIEDWILSSFVAESAQSVVSYIDGFVETLHTKTLGTIGAVGMILAAYSLFGTVEKSFNGIWRVRKHRSVTARFQILASILIVVPTLLVLSLYLSGRFEKLKILGAMGGVPSAGRTLLFLGPLALTTFSIFFLFKFVPNTPVRWKPALAAALTASVLLEAAKAGFNQYVLRFIPYSKIYGALGLIPLFMFWIYLTWLVILTGVILSYVLQNLSTLQQETWRSHESNPFSVPVHEEWGVRIAAALARRFSRGEGPVDADRVARDVNLPIPHVEDHLQLLAKAKVLLRIPEPEGYVFARPLDQLTVGDIENVFRAQLKLHERSGGGTQRHLLARS